MIVSFVKEIWLDKFSLVIIIKYHCLINAVPNPRKETIADFEPKVVAM